MSPFASVDFTSGEDCPSALDREDCREEASGFSVGAIVAASGFAGVASPLGREEGERFPETGVFIGGGVAGEAGTGKDSRGAALPSFSFCPVAVASGFTISDEDPARLSLGNCHVSGLFAVVDRNAEGSSGALTGTRTT